MALFAVYQIDKQRESTTTLPMPTDDLKVSTEQETNIEEVSPEPLRLAVTPASFDDMGKLLATLGTGYQYVTIEEAALEDPAALADVDVLFVTCTEAPDRTAASQTKVSQTLREFVGRGGTLYASDLRFDTLAEAFPEFVDITAVAQGKSQDLDAEVLDPHLRELVGTTMRLHFDLEGWRPAAFGGPDVSTYLRGEFQTTAGVSIQAPLLVKFRFGDGTVVFTSFHNEKQNSDAEIQLLKYLVFTTVTAKIESKVTKTMISGGFSPQEQNLLSATPESPSITHTYQHPEPSDLQFALGFEQQGARLRLEITGPDGTRYADAGTSTFTISVPSAVAGAWRYTVTAEQLPYRNFPFTLTVGAVSKQVQEPAPRPSALQIAEVPTAVPDSVSDQTITFREVELATKQTVKQWRIAVTPHQYDDMGRLLDRLGEGYKYDNVSMGDLLNPATLDQYDVLFLTCASQGAGTQQLREQLRAFVEKGGTLYASDLRYEMIAATFPEFVDPGNQSPTSMMDDPVLQQAIKQLQELQVRLQGAAAVESIAEALQSAGLSSELAGQLQPIAAALESTTFADSTQPPTTGIRKALSDIGLASVSNADVASIAKALRDRALRINRAKYESQKEDLPSKIAAAQERVRERVQQLGGVAAITATPPQQLTATVVEPGLREILGPTMQLNFDLADWRPANFSGPTVTVYLQGEYQSGPGRAESPLLVKFPVGDGTLIFTSFHNEAQNSEEEDKLLRYLVFTAVTAKEEALLAKTMVSGGFSPAKKSLLSHSSGDPTITQTYRNTKPGRLQFALGLAGKGARLHFRIVGPNEQQYEKETQSTLIVEVPDAPVGDWRYTVTALQVPYENFPFTVSIGEAAN
jgi:hypothetical protein